MAHKLPCAFRQILDEVLKRGQIQPHGCNDANAAVRRNHVRCCQLIAKCRLIPLQYSKLKPSLPISRGSKHNWLEWISYRADATCPCSPQNSFQRDRKHVSVLVTVEVRDVNPASLQLFDLCSYFSFDFVLVQPPGRGQQAETNDTLAKTWPRIRDQARYP